MAFSSDSDADELSRSENRLFSSQSHSIEQWAYGYPREGYYNDNEPLNHSLTQAQRAQEARALAAAEQAALAAARAAQANATHATSSRGQRGMKKKKTRGKKKTLKGSTSKSNKSNKSNKGRNKLNRRKLKATKVLKHTRTTAWKPAPAKSPTRQARQKKIRTAQEDSYMNSLSPTKKPSVSRLNLSNLNKVGEEDATTATATATSSRTRTTPSRSSRSFDAPRRQKSTFSVSRLNRSSASARSVGGYSTRSIGGGGGKNRKRNKEVASLRLRLAGTHNAIRSLQEQLHERTAEVDELRAQLLSKTRALEAARAGQNSGALNRSYVSQAKRSGKEAQAKRKYAVQLEEMEKECDEAIIKARKKEQRAIEINADLRNEIHRLRVVSEKDAVQLKDLNAMLSEMKGAIEMERQYSASLLSGEGGGGNGDSGPVYNEEQAMELNRSNQSNIVDLLKPNVTVRMLRQEISQLRTVLSQQNQEKTQQETRALRASGRSNQLEKENSVLRNRVAVGSFGRRRTTAFVSKKKSKVKQTALRPNNGRRSGSAKKRKQTSALGERNGKGMVRNSPSPSKSRSGGGIVEQIAAKSTREAERYAKLKKMYDRART